MNLALDLTEDAHCPHCPHSPSARRVGQVGRGGGMRRPGPRQARRVLSISGWPGYQRGCLPTSRSLSLSPSLSALLLFALCLCLAMPGPGPARRGRGPRSPRLLPAHRRCARRLSPVPYLRYQHLCPSLKVTPRYATPRLAVSSRTAEGGYALSGVDACPNARKSNVVEMLRRPTGFWCDSKLLLHLLTRLFLLPWFLPQFWGATHVLHSCIPSRPLPLE